MPFIYGTNRQDILLFPEAIDDYICEENPVRFIDAFVNQLDLAVLGFTHSTSSQTGRPAYHPADLLKLYIYGYLNRVRSSRMLERESQRNVEVMWLIGKLTPDHKTISDFRKNNPLAIRLVCREFTLLCRKLELFSADLVAIDGSKFRAVNNRSRNFTQQKLEKLMTEADERIDAYLKELDYSDAEEPEVKRLTAEQMREKIQKLKERKQKYQGYAQQLEESGHTQLSLTDKDARLMKDKAVMEVCYNVQTAVDAKHKLIIEHEVTNDVTDKNQLSKMAMKAKQMLGAEELDVVADMGYFDGAEVKKCQAEKITTYIAQPYTSANQKHGLYTKDEFRYDKEKDCYICPQGEELTYRFDTVELGRHIRYYTTSKCRDCPAKKQCTRAERGRRITRWVDEHLLEEMAKRVKAKPDVMKQRKELVEHPFGTMKRWMNQGYFLMRGLKKVRAEMSLTVMAYNIKRAVNIIGTTKMIEAVV